MSRPRALSHAQVFALADQLKLNGQKPTVVRIGERAKVEFGVTPSFTTLKRSLGEWERFGGADRPREMSDAFLELIVNAFTPLYGQLVAQVRAEVESRATTAEAALNAAQSQLDTVGAERDRLVDEVNYLREQLERAQTREQGLLQERQRQEAMHADTKADLRAREQQCSFLTATLETERSALATAESHLRERETEWSAAREHLLSKHQLALESLHERQTLHLDALQNQHALKAAELAMQIHSRDVELAVMRRLNSDLTRICEQLRESPFELGAIDYLLKPFEDERFELALDRTEQRHRLGKLGDVAQPLNQLLDRLQDAVPLPKPVPSAYVARFAVESGGEMRIVPVEEVQHISAGGHYVVLHSGPKTYVMRERMDALEHRLDPARFFRVHRSAIVQLKHIRSLVREAGGDYSIKLESGAVLPVGRSRVGALVHWMGIAAQH